MAMKLTVDGSGAATLVLDVEHFDLSRPGVAVEYRQPELGTTDHWTIRRRRRTRDGRSVKLWLDPAPSQV